MDSVALPPRAAEGIDRFIPVINRLALLVAVVVALTIPIGYSSLQYSDLTYRTERLALVKAGAITDLVTSNPRLWSYQVHRLEELLTNYPVPNDNSTANVYDEKGRWILRVGEPPAWPVLARSSPLYDSGRVVGRVEISHSLRAFLAESAVATLLGLLLGGAIYGVMRIWPLRALRRMRVALEAEQAAVRSREERFRILFDRASEGILILSPDGNLIAANESFARMHGYGVDELRNRSLRDLNTPETLPGIAPRLQRLLAGESLTFEVEHVHKDGHVISLEVSSSMISSDGEIVFQAFHRDITERKRAQAERARLESQLRESQKMEALGTLAGGVAHDFNNIIAAILGNVALARHDLPAGHPARESLDEIGSASGRARDLVKQILAFGRRQALSRTVTPLAPVVEEAARLLRPSLRGAVTIAIDCAADTPPVLADATQIQQLLLNLCTNAWHAIRGEGKPGVIEVRLAAHRAQDTPPVLLAPQTGGEAVMLRPGRYACLTVRDNGPGMDEATRSRIFEPFFTTKPPGEGTGLGLSVVYGIVESHEARISVESEPGKGATFRIFFPAADEWVPAGDAKDSSPAAGDAANPRAAGKHVLYVDDDESIVKLMARLLPRQGLRVSGYTDALEALAVVRADPAQFDLAVTDYNMPHMSGLQMAQALHDLRADLPVVVISGYISEELRAGAPAAGVRELIYKPGTITELCDVVTRLANGTQSATTQQANP